MTVGHPLTEQTQEPRFTGPGDADLETLLLIRHFERALLDLFARGEVGGTTHTCLGQEIVPVALAPLLDGDHVFSNHRGHGHYLAHCQDPEGLLAEITGREGAVCAGVGGSQHLHRERYLSTGVQGQTLPIAVGVGLHLVGRGEGRVVVVYVGDGTWGEGAVYEALNMASLWRVPLLLVVEDNGIAQSTPTRRQMAGTVAERAQAFNIPFRSSSTLWVDELRAEIAPVLDRVRQERTPAVFQVETVRLGPHSKGDDLRSAEDLEHARERDWYVHYGRRFGERFTTIDRRQEERVSAIVTDVLARPLSTWKGGPVVAVITVYELVAQILKLRLEEVTDETGAATTAAWTSLRHVELVVAIEKFYGIRLAPREARSVRSVAHVRRVLATHGVQT